MRKGKIVQVLVGLLLVAALVLIPMACKAPEVSPVTPPAAPPEEVAPPTAPPEEVAPPEEEVVAPPVEGLAPFVGLADIPEIKNRRGIHVSLMGFSAEWLEPLVNKWAEHTKIPMTYELVTFSLVYPKLNLELIAGTGAYDMIPVEASYSCEWSPYLWDIYEMADEFDPGGRAALAADVAQIYPAILRQTSDRAGRLCGIPFFTYQQALWLRQDVYDDPTEQANFLAECGYELAPPTTYDELYAQEEFFTREKGELLKGEPLEWDLYGCAIGGRVEINDDTSADIWGRGGHWFDIIRDEQGNAIEYVVTKENKEVIGEALTSMKKQFQWASPGCLTGYWNDFVPAFIKGRHIIMPHNYACHLPWASGIFDEVPGAEIGLYQGVGVGGTGIYCGNFFQGFPKGSKNPEAAYWLMRYIASYAAQKEMVEAGNSGTRMDILRDPKYATGITMVPEYGGVICHDQSGTVGALAAILDGTLTNNQTAEVVNDYIWFNSSAGGKMYEMTMILCHEAVAGIRPIDETVDEIVRQMIDLETKFGDIPIREEL